ncbi:hypothetical protein AVDCRST_MAG94-4065, partial [uncultured Leptolyngbya sp.]
CKAFSLTFQGLFALFPLRSSIHCTMGRSLLWRYFPVPAVTLGSACLFLFL